MIRYPHEKARWGAAGYFWCLQVMFCWVNYASWPGHLLTFCLDFCADLAEEDEVGFPLWDGHQLSMEPHLISGLGCCGCPCPQVMGRIYVA